MVKGNKVSSEDVIIVSLESHVLIGMINKFLIS